MVYPPYRLCLAVCYVSQMLSEAIKDRLGDRDYLDLHLAAIASVAKLGEVPWYDAHFLRRFEAAKLYIGEVAPEYLERFVAGFAPLRPADKFEICTIDALFDDAVRHEIGSVVQSLPAAQLERHEVEKFGRDVVHDHPFFLQLQQGLLPLVSELAERELVTGYNFLSLYGGSGQCAPHLDEPMSMYTLDYCIEQSGSWPIHFSKQVELPDADAMQAWNEEDLKDDAGMDWTSHELEPNQALLFNGSSQWHYRDPITRGGYCNLLFFHFYPAGCEKLVRPHLWAEHFELSILQPLCDVFAAESENRQIW